MIKIRKEPRVRPDLADAVARVVEALDADEVTDEQVQRIAQGIGERMARRINRAAEEMARRLRTAFPDWK